jgi:hypothetical protein
MSSKLKITQARANVSTAQNALESVGMPSTTELRSTALDNPMSMVTKARCSYCIRCINVQQVRIADGTGQAAAEAQKATTDRS